MSHIEPLSLGHWQATSAGLSGTLQFENRTASGRILVNIDRDSHGQRKLTGKGEAHAGRPYFRAVRAKFAP